MASKAKTSPAVMLVEFARQKAKDAKSWEELHNAVYGIGGMFGQIFPTQSERTAFAKSAEFREIAELIRSLQGESGVADMQVASGKFILRLPASLHAALIAEAEHEGVSLNTLCLAKLSIQLRAAVR